MDSNGDPESQQKHAKTYQNLHRNFPNHPYSIAHFSTAHSYVQYVPDNASFANKYTTSSRTWNYEDVIKF